MAASPRRVFLRTLVAAGAGAGAAAAACGTARAKVSAPGPDAVGMLYDATRCIGCKACVVKCREVSGLPPDRRLGPLHDAPLDLDGGTKTLIRLARSGSQRSFVKSQCMHCVDPACVSACMLGAMQRQADGSVTWRASHCIGCRYCGVACPYNVPKFEWASATPRLVKCELCKERRAEGKLPGCVEACPREAVIFGKRADLLADARARLARHPDRYLPHVYGERDGGGTHVLYLSAVPFRDLGLPELGEEPVASLPETIQHGLYQGFVTPAVLYAALGVVAWRNRRKGEEP